MTGQVDRGKHRMRFILDDVDALDVILDKT